MRRIEFREKRADELAKIRLLAELNFKSMDAFRKMVPQVDSSSVLNEMIVRTTNKRGRKRVRGIPESSG